MFVILTDSAVHARTSALSYLHICRGCREGTLQKAGPRVRYLLSRLHHENEWERDVSLFVFACLFPPAHLERNDEPAGGEVPGWEWKPLGLRDEGALDTGRKVSKLNLIAHSAAFAGCAPRALMRPDFNLVCTFHRNSPFSTWCGHFWERWCPQSRRALKAGEGHLLVLQYPHLADKREGGHIPWWSDAGSSSHADRLWGPILSTVLGHAACHETRPELLDFDTSRVTKCQCCIFAVPTERSKF